MATLASLLVRLAVDRTAFTTNMRNAKADAEDFAVGVTKSMNTAAASAEAAWDRIAAAQAKVRGTQASFGRVKMLKGVLTDDAEAATNAIQGATGAVDEMSKSTSMLNTHLQTTKFLLASFIVLGTIGFFHNAATAAADFQSQMLTLHTQARATTDEVRTMTDAVMKMAVPLRTGPEALAEALYHIESVGYRGEKALTALTVAAQGARVGNANLTDVTNALVAAMTSGIEGVDNLQEAMGTLDAIVGTGNMTMEEMVTSLRSGLLSTAKQFGVSLQDIGAALATMTDQGIPAAEASTRLRISIALMSAPTQQAQRQLSRIGLTSLDIAKAMNGPGGLIDALTLLKTKLTQSGLSAEEQSQLLTRAFGGGRTSSGILTLINSLDLMNQKMDVIQSTSKKFPELVAAQAETATAKFQELQAVIEVLSIQLGSIILPVAVAFAQALSFIAQQTYIVIPALMTLMAVITAIATKAMVDMIKSGLGLIRTFVVWIATNTGLSASLIAMATAENAATISTAGLAAAAGTLLAVLGPLAIALAAVGIAYAVVGSGLQKQEDDIAKSVQNLTQNTETSIAQLEQAKAALEAGIAQNAKQITEGGGTFAGVWDVFGTGDKLRAQLDVVNNEIARRQNEAGRNAATNFKDGYITEWNGVIDETKTLVQQFGATLEGVDAAAAVAGGNAMMSMADEIKNNRELVLNAFKDIRQGLKDELSVDAEIARDYGILISRDLAEGLASSDPEVYARSIALKKVLEDRLTELTEGAYQEGMAFGKNYVQGQIDAMIAAGDTYSELRGMREQLQSMPNPWEKWKPSMSAINDQMTKLNQQLQDSKEYSSALSDLDRVFGQIQRAAEEYFSKVHQETLRAIDDQLKHKNAILDAKKALNQAPVTAAQKALDEQRAKIEEFRLKEAIAQATTPEAYRDAVLALQDFYAQQKINEMQAQVDAANEKIDAQKDMNERLAEQQRQAENDRYERMQRDFERQLGLLKDYLSKHPGEWQNVEDKIIKLLNGYGFSYKDAGKKLGEAFVEGLRDQVKAAQEAAKALADAINSAGIPNVGDTTGGFAAGTASLRAAERALNRDLNGNGIIGLKSGMWNVLNDNLLAFLHQDEMVAPADTADILRQIGDKPMNPKAYQTPGFNRAMEASDGAYGRGGTIIFQVGDEKIAELLDESLTVHESVYVTKRPTLSSRR